MNPENGRPDRRGRLGPYRLDQRLGSGGMGEVWRAWDERLRRWVALKQVRAEAAPRHGRERLRREARAVARLNHPAIIHVYDILEGEDGDWIVMELAEGRTLRQLLDDETALSPPRAVQLGRQIVEGLAEAHAHGILHRDLKATNVVVTPSGRAKILDFGLAKEIAREEGPEVQEPTISAPGLILGTCFAMSPEQAFGRPLDERSDLFSLGSLLYEMLTGEAPFRAETAAQSLARVLHFEPPPLQESHPTIPAEVSDLVGWLLRKEPSHRPQSTAVVLKALETASGPPGGGAAAVLRPAPASGGGDESIVTMVEGPASPVARPTPLPAKSGRQPSSGERRTVTIAGCALVPLDRPPGESGAFDPEVVSEAAVAFEGLGREVCRELGGSLGGVLSRRLWLCFGYPQAHEDDAERAVRAARELAARFAALPLAAAQRFAVRAGVHTGPAVVVSRPDTGPALQASDAFDIAMAVQSQAPAGRIAVSAASRRLLERRFATQPLPAVHLKDLDATVEVYELGRPLEPETGEGPSPSLVNRETELRILFDRFHLARSGAGQAVVIAGEAGIGKSRLVRALSEQVADEAATWLIAHGSAFAQNTPLAPIVQLLARAIFAPEGEAEGSGEERLQQLEAFLDGHALPVLEYAPLLGALLSLPVEGRYPTLVLSPEARRKRTLAAILALLSAMAEHRPVVLAIEDLHWIDPSTLDFLDLLLSDLPGLPLLLVATFRPEFTPPWQQQTAVTQLSLGGLSATHTEQLIERVTEGKPLPPELHREIVARTDGIPLFVEELTKAVLEGGASPQKAAAIPFTLGGSLLARLDRLGEAKAVAQLAAILGRAFSLEQLEAFSWIKGAALRAALGQLLEAEILHRRGPSHRARYIFKHALVQDTAYLSLLASDRRELHQRLVRLLKEEFPKVAEAEPELMAHHCERGGLPVEAIGYLQEAGIRAMQRSAHLEAIRHLTRALDLLLELPPAPELLRPEFELRGVLGPCLAAIKGWGAAEIATNAERCVALCRELGDRGRLFPSLFGLNAYHVLRGHRQPAIDLAAEIARLAETPVQVFLGYSAQVVTCFYGGRFTETLAFAEQASTLYEPNLLPEFAQVFGEESTLVPCTCEFWALWILGQPETAARKRDAVLAAVEALGSPFQLGFVLLFDMLLWHELREPDQVDRVAKRLLGLSKEQEFLFFDCLARCGQGWVTCQHGDFEGGTELIRAGLDLKRATGALLAEGYWRSYLIEAHLAAGRFAEGLADAHEALARSETHLDVFYDAELLRLQGELLRASEDAGAAEASLKKSLDVARQQGARAFELRAATSLGRLLAEQGRTSEALPPLAAVCQAFGEGFATRDFVEARDLLDQLSSSQEMTGQQVRSSRVTPSKPRTKSAP